MLQSGSKKEVGSVSEENKAIARRYVEDAIAEEDRVAIRFTFRGTHQGDFMDIPPTGKQVTMQGIDILRVENGKVAELWGQEDMLGLMQQLGAIPAPEQSEEASPT